MFQSCNQECVYHVYIDIGLKSFSSVSKIVVFWLKIPATFSNASMFHVLYSSREPVGTIRCDLIIEKFS